MLKFHTIVEDIIAKLEVLVPHGGGAEFAVCLMISISAGDSFAFVGIREQERGGLLPGDRVECGARSKGDGWSMA